MAQPLKDALDVCKTIMRNGHDAYVVGAALQEQLIGGGSATEVDLATDMTAEDLRHVFPELSPVEEEGVLGRLGLEGFTVRIFLTEEADAGHPDAGIIRATPGLRDRLDAAESPACPVGTLAQTKDIVAVGGRLALMGIPDETLQRDYLLAVRLLRLAANYQLDIDPNSWAAVVRAARRVNDYVAAADILDEMRKVEAENLHHFFRLMFDSMILHGIMPELAACSRITQTRDDDGSTETVLDHTLEVMRRYPEELPYDWFGTLACLFHDVGKLFTAEYACEGWAFFQHHKVGAKVTRKILSRLGFSPKDTDLVCHLVRHHMRFHFMLTDKGIRRFKALDEYPRLIELARADVKAKGGDYTNFNHNMKYLRRADVAEELVEPLLNGRRIMACTGMTPGPGVGLLRDALLKAQIAGEVSSIDEAEEYVRACARREGLGER